MSDIEVKMKKNFLKNFYKKIRQNSYIRLLLHKKISYANMNVHDYLNKEVCVM